MSKKSPDKYYYLALGDSYSIGERVSPEDNFPNQVFRMIATYEKGFQAPRIVARTGWTTGELKTGIREAGITDPFRSHYDLVSLLIGVNDQYRGRPVEEYRPAFESLLKEAIGFAGGIPGNVVVLSIPDWGVTPFAAGRDREQIARDIDAYNSVNREIALSYGTHYINITAWTREGSRDPSLLADDGLHPSGKEYRRWAAEINSIFKETHGK